MSLSTIKLMFKTLLYNVFLYTKFYTKFFYSIISLKDIPLYLNKTKIYIYIVLLYLLSLEVKHKSWYIKISVKKKIYLLSL